MVIRPYRSSDCPTLAQIYYDTIHAVNAADYTPAQLDAWATGKVNLDGFFRQSRSHSEQIAKFLSILELLKTRYVALQEEESADSTEALNLSSNAYIVLCKEPDTEFLEALTEYS